MNDKSKINETLYSLSYSRQVSRAHTIFGAWVEIIIGTVIGFFGIFFSYSEVYDLQPDKFKIIFMVMMSFVFIGVISVIAFYFLYESRMERKTVVNKLKSLGSA